MAVRNSIIRCFLSRIPAALRYLPSQQNCHISFSSYSTKACSQLLKRKLPFCDERIVGLTSIGRISQSVYHTLASFRSRETLLAPVHSCWPSFVHLQIRDTHSSVDLSQPIFLSSEKHLNNTAIVDTQGSFSYADILHHSMCLAVEILGLHGAVQEMKLNGERIALLTDRDVTYVIGQYATWICNGISVPLCESHPPSEWEYFLKDAECSLLLVADTLAEKIILVAQAAGIKVKVISRKDFGTYEKNRWFQADHATNPRQVRKVFQERKQRWFDRMEEFVMKKSALIVYTSGTTGRPKGVVLTHGNLSAMVSGMIKNWEWTSNDAILHILPLHHVHGIANVLLTPLACGAACIMEPKFDAHRVWSLLTSPAVEHFDRSINLFMAVPTIYAKLIQYYDEHIVKSKAAIVSEFVRQTTSSKIRLMVSGSAALPQPIHERWAEITGHVLLERYGMTETGMILSNPLHGTRVPGAVGTPMPNVEVRISKPNIYSPLGYDIIAEGNSRHTVVTQGLEDDQGELLVRGPSVFKEYWKKPEATEESFTKDGWFKTGDTAKFSNGVYSIVGRTSVDVIKSGGYKISALHVEQKLLSHPEIVDVAVVGLADVTWGQKVAAVVVLKPGYTLELKDLREWAADHLPPYQIPTKLLCVDSIPRNVMGKVNKKELVTQLFPESASRKW
ncbi:unnamed protein product [Candidula unifasciata]|uniref:Acyl-CoA synthetase family member 3, mitochondrial n=1 Tax=Candidula unifasciata TaxID=100452 RepID=A0A8S3Z8Z4_9EUPU|nr:unnamed protein product [Candidula unifasciata]